MSKRIILSESQVKMLVTEEITKSDVERIVADMVKRDKSLESRVKEITAEVIKNLFRTLWQRNSLYDNDIKR